MNLKAILKPGKQVELSIQDADAQMHKLKTLIESGFDGDNIGVIAPIEDGNYYPLHSNDKLTVTFDVSSDDQGKKKDVFNMQCVVLGRKKADGQTVVMIGKRSAPKKIQRRNTFRLHLLKSVTFSYNGKSNVILLKNISSTGLRGIIEERIPSGTELSVSLDLENENEPMVIQCNVIACDQVADSMIQYDLRLQFLNLTNADKTKLTNFIFRKQSEFIRKTVDTEGHSVLSSNTYGYSNNRRHGDDFIMRTVPLLGLISWFISLSILALIVESRPEIRYNLDQFFNYYKRGYWRGDLLNIAFFASLFEIGLCSAGLYMNSMRMKRDDDQYNRSLIINLIFAVLAIFMYIIFPLGQ